MQGKILASHDFMHAVIFRQVFTWTSVLYREELSRILFNKSTNICFWHSESTSWDGNHIHV